MKHQFIIVDWAGNILNFKGYFQLWQMASPMLFDSFDDGWAWISENMAHDQHDTVEVERYSKSDIVFQ
jgi:hypothetical protein